jgi:hypothetical protein
MITLAYWMLGLFSRFSLAFGKSQKYVPHVLSQYDLQNIDGRSQVKSGFTKERVGQCSRLRATSHI